MPEISAAPENAARGELCLLLIGERQLSTHWLPEEGELVLGRDPGSDVLIEDASVAPAQALLRVGATLSITDLAGTGNTRVRNLVLERGQTVEFAASELVHVGNVMVLVQKRAHAPTRRIWTHGYFETRLEEECLRAERFKTSFAILRVEASPAISSSAVEERLSKVLRLIDVVGAYGPGVYQVLLSETQPEDAQLVSGRLVAKLRELGDVRVGVACHPRDARSADELTAKASEQLHGAGKEESADDETAPMRHLQQLVGRVAASTINVLILGETGVGKEKLAQQVHRLSPRAAKPFLGLNGAALSESLLESELFGHERGAFTGAVTTKIGLLEAAEGGTVFLDEVGELPMSIQAKLLRVLETRQVLRVGSVKPRLIDIRFLAATNADLDADVARGRFRQDLFFRLNGVSLMIPPLRERISEIPELAKAFVAEACRKYTRASVPAIAPEVFDLMRRYRWPGNIRELRNVVERAVVICDDDLITLSHLPVEKLMATFASRSMPAPPQSFQGQVRSVQSVPSERRHEDGTHGQVASPVAAISLSGFTGAANAVSASPSSHPPASGGARTRDELLHELKVVERQRIVDALAQCVGNQTRAAEVLGMSRRTLVNRMIALGIPGPRRRRTPAV